MQIVWIGPDHMIPEKWRETVVGHRNDDGYEYTDTRHYFREEKYIAWVKSLPRHDDKTLVIPVDDFARYERLRQLESWWIRYMLTPEEIEWSEVFKLAKK